MLDSKSRPHSTLPQTLQGKVFIVTGAARGIGAACAEHLSDRGASLHLVDLGCNADGTGTDPEPVRLLAEALQRKDVRISHSCSDIGAPGNAAETLALTLAEHGHIDGVVSAAGFVRERGIVHLAQSDLQDLLNVYVQGPSALLSTLSRHWISLKQPGSMVFLSGQSAFFPAARGAAAAAAFAGLSALVRSAALELRRHDIRANVVVPLARTRLTTDSRLFASLPEHAMPAQAIAPLIHFLLSDQSKDVHGEILGSAGPRTYSITMRETPGWFVHDALPSESDFEEHWYDIVRS